MSGMASALLQLGCLAYNLSASPSAAYTIGISAACHVFVLQPPCGFMQRDKQQLYQQITIDSVTFGKPFVIYSVSIASQSPASSLIGECVL